MQAQPRAPAPPRPEALHGALTALRPLLQPGSLLLLLSDFAGLDEAGEGALAVLAARSECRLLQLTDPLEEHALPAGAFRIGLPGRSWWIDGERSRGPWLEAWEARKRQLDALAARLNLPLARLDTAVDAVEQMRGLLLEPAWAA